MTGCRVCGREFDPLRFQVVVPALGEGFDRVECAQQAAARVTSATVPAPLPAVVRAPPPAAAFPAPAAARAGRAPLLVGANLAFLAAGTAAAVYLWFRVFGVDPTALEPASLVALPAVERSTVPAQISTSERISSPSSASAPPRQSASAPTRGSIRPAAASRPVASRATAGTVGESAGSAGGAAPRAAPAESPARAEPSGGGSAVGARTTLERQPPSQSAGEAARVRDESGGRPRRAKGPERRPRSPASRGKRGKQHGPAGSHSTSHTAGQGKKIGHGKHQH